MDSRCTKKLCRIEDSHLGRPPNTKYVFGKESQAIHSTGSTIATPLEGGAFISTVTAVVTTGEDGL